MLKEMDVNLPTDSLYHLLLDWFRSQRDIKVKDCSESAFIKVKTGTHWWWRKAPCEVRVNLEARKTGTTHVAFNFDFSEVYAVTLVITVAGLILVGFFFGLDTVAFCLIPLTFALLGIYRDLEKTKRKFIDRTRNFLKAD